MGFNAAFINWIKILYRNPKSRVRINGHCSDFFPLGRGTRQGDGLSPCLFILSIEPLAELIRSDSRIQGIRDDANIQHKLALFADDILLFIENPVTSIPVLLQHLNEYSSVSGYKVNTNKSEAMMIAGNWPNELDKIVTFKKSTNGFRYLGIHLAPNFTQLFNLNYGKLMQEVKKDLNRWDVLPLSLLGRIESVRMNILPRFLFLFQSLPISVPNSTFLALDKLITTFIWQKRKPRVRLKTLMTSKEKGGLGLPNIKLYYWSTRLRTISSWVINDPDILWVPIEQNSIPGLPLCNTPFMNQKSLKKINISNPWIVQTLKTWNIIQKQIRGTSGLSRAMPIVGNIEFLPSITDVSFKRWVDQGLIVTNQLLCGHIFKSFLQLQEEFSLPRNDLFRYLQIRDYLMKHSQWESVTRNPTIIEEYFIRLFEKQKPTRKIISLMYKNLMGSVTTDTLHIKHQWELEMNVIITDESWRKMSSQCHKGINSQNWREFDWKTKFRFFLTPLRTFTIKNTPTNTCWRKCNMVGDHTHIFWDCPKIKRFWENIKKISEDTLRIDLPMEPQVFILDLYPSDALSADQRYLLHILLMTARKTITMNWLKPQPPTVDQWTQKLKSVYLMEYLTAQLQLKTDLFTRRWSKVSKILQL